MKKTKLMALAMAVVCTLSLMGCGGKHEEISSSQFKETMEDADYEIIDISGDYDEADGFSEYYLAESDDGYQIEFVVCTDTDAAESMYAGMDEQLEENDGNGTNTSISTSNYAHRKMTTDGTYYYLARVGSTLLYTETDQKYKGDIEEIVKTLGY